MFTTINTEHYQEIIKFIQKLNSIEAFEKGVLQLLRNLVEFDRGLFVTLKYDSSVDKIYKYEIQPDFFKEYESKFRVVDPIANFKYRSACESVADQTKIFDFESECHDNSALKNFYRKYDIAYSLMFPINDHGDGIRLYRSKNASNFSLEDYEICKLLGSCIGNSYEHYLKDEEAKFNAKLFKMIRANMYFGAIILDDKFKMISYNKIGIERMSQITQKNVISDIILAMADIIKEMLEEEAKTGQSLSIYKITDNYIIELLINRELDEYGNIVTNYIAFLYGKAWFSSILTLSTEKVIENYHLTEREKQLVGLILHGYSSQQISEQLFISTYTVKEHIKSIFRKMNLKSRGELIIKVYTDRAQDLRTFK